MRGSHALGACETLERVSKAHAHAAHDRARMCERAIARTAASDHAARATLDALTSYTATACCAFERSIARSRASRATLQSYHRDLRERATANEREARAWGALVRGLRRRAVRRAEAEASWED